MKTLINKLSEFVLDERHELFQSLIVNRTRYITVVLEDIFQPQNASAVLRTCDCFGVQDVHIIENKYEYNINPDVVLGSSKWLSINQYNENPHNTLRTINKLRENGYRIIATTPHTNDVTLNDFDLKKGKSALLFGTELTGLSDVAMEHADEFVRIPMYGFTESYNISVSAAMVIHTLTEKMRRSNIDWHLSDEERDFVMINWLRNSVKRSDEIERELLKLPQFHKNYL